MATRLDYRSRVRTELKIDPNSRIWNDTTLNRAIQQAIYQVQQDGDYGWSFNDSENTTATVVSQAIYNLPTTFVKIEGGVKWNSSALNPVSYNWLVTNYDSLAVDGEPNCYYLRGSNIGLFPRPNAIQNLTYLYRGKLAAFSDDTTDNGIPDEFTEAIVQYACYLLWSDIEGREDKAIQALQNYKQVLEGLFEQFLNARDESFSGWSFEAVSGSFGLTNYN